jgi:fatty acyl-CoA reductase
VYNSAAHELKRITIADVSKIGLKLAEEIPLTSIMWKPSVIITKYQAWYYVTVILLHLIPGLLFDGLIKLSGNKPMYVNIHCIIYIHIYILLMMLYLSAAGITNFK